ncbi:MAG: hypothetical protein QME14_03690 [Methanobacteriaceae archaeon]|nr:hypothetical protein [Methanobacteriaceae archaeon]
MKRYIVLIFLLILAIIISGCAYLDQDRGEQRQAEAESYAKETDALTYQGYGFTFFYPNYWENYTESDWLVTLGDPDDSKTYIYVDQRKLQSNETVKEILDKAIKNATSDSTRNITIIARENIKVNNLPYEIVIIREKLVEGEMQYIQAWFERNGTAYLLGGVTTPGRFESMNKTFCMFIYSFNFY